MAKYIDAEKLTAEFDKCLWGKEWDKALARACVDKAPTVEVVRCKDCKWFDRTHPYGTLIPVAFHCKVNDRFFTDGFYCGYGERRTDEEPT